MFDGSGVLHFEAFFFKKNEFIFVYSIFATKFEKPFSYQIFANFVILDCYENCFVKLVRLNI